MYTHESEKMYKSLAEYEGKNEDDIVARKQQSYASFAATIVDLLDRNGVPAMTLFDDKGHALVFCVAGLNGMSPRAAAAFAPWLKTKDDVVVLRLDVGFFSRMKLSADGAMRRWSIEARQLFAHFGVAFSGSNDDLLAFIDAIPGDAEGTIRAMLGNPPVPVFLLDFVCDESCTIATENQSQLITLSVL